MSRELLARKKTISSTLFVRYRPPPLLLSLSNDISTLSALPPPSNDISTLSALCSLSTHFPLIRRHRYTLCSLCFLSSPLPPSLPLQPHQYSLLSALSSDINVLCFPSLFFSLSPTTSVCSLLCSAPSNYINILCSTPPPLSLSKDISTLSPSLSLSLPLSPSLQPHQCPLCSLLSLSVLCSLPLLSALPVCVLWLLLMCLVVWRWR